VREIPGLDWIRRRFGRQSTRTIDDVALVDVPKGSDPQDVLDAVRAESFDAVEGVVIEAEIDRYTPHVLRGVRRVIDDNCRVMPTLLVGVDYHTKMLERAAELFDATIALSPDKERRIHRLEPHYAELLRQVDRLGDLGSVRTFDVAVTDHRRTVEALRVHKGEPLHPLGETDYPPFYAYRAPDQFVDTAERVLGELGWVIDAQTTTSGTLSVTSFTFGIDDSESDEDVSVPVSG
jgi:hypothetical protein